MSRAELRLKFFEGNYREYLGTSIDFIKARLDTDMSTSLPYSRFPLSLNALMFTALSVARISAYGNRREFLNEEETQKYNFFWSRLLRSPLSQSISNYMIFLLYNKFT